MLSKIQLTPFLKSGVCRNMDFSWDEVTYMVKHPRFFKGSGSEIQLWSFYNLVDSPILGEFGQPRGIADNVKEVVAMQLDFDGGRTMQSFAKEFKEYTWALYTSKSHSSALHKFRVVMPLDKPVARELFSNKKSKEYLMDIFKGCDKTTFDRWRKQRVPYVTPESVHQYKFHINDGMLYSLDTSILLANYEEAKVMYSRSGNASTVDLNASILDMTFDELEEVNKLNALITIYEDELASINWLNRGAGEDVHSRARRVIYSLRMNGMGSSEVYNFVMSYCPHKPNLEKEMHDLAFCSI